MVEVMQEGRSLAETPTYSVASVVTVMVFVCFIVERSIYRFGKWLKKTRRKALHASLEKMKEELMLLGLISLLLAQCARWISEICVNSSLFTSTFYLCSEKDYGVNENVIFESTFSFVNESDIPPKGINTVPPHQCGEGREPFVSHQGLEQLHRFLFVLGITHVLYSCLAVGVAMSKIYSWRNWENQATIANVVGEGNMQAKREKMMRRQTTFLFHHTDHPWSRNRVMIWMVNFYALYAFNIGISVDSAMCTPFNIVIIAKKYPELCFVRQFRTSIQKSDYSALRLGFITKHKLPLSYNFHNYMVRSMEDEFQGILGISWPLWGYTIVCIFINIHGLNIYFWISFIPAVLIMMVGTKLQHIVSSLALEVLEQTGRAQVKPCDDLFWFGKPEILLRLVQFIIFQNAFEMATFIWSLWGIKERSCFMKNHMMIAIRLTSGVIVQLWCSYSTVPINILITQMGSQCKKTVVAESVRESLHSWCKRVKHKSKHSQAARSVCSLDTTTTIDEGDEVTVASGTLSRTSSIGSLNNAIVASSSQGRPDHDQSKDEHISRVEDYLSDSLRMVTSEALNNALEDNADEQDEGEGRVVTLFDLFRKT